MRTKRAPDIRSLVAEAADWPTIKETAEDWELPERYVRSVVERGKVKSIHLDHIRVNPESFENYIEDVYCAGQY